MNLNEITNTNNFNYSTNQELITDPSVILNKNNNELFNLLNKPKGERDKKIVNELMNNELIKSGSQLQTKKSLNLDASNYSYNRINSISREEENLNKNKYVYRGMNSYKAKHTQENQENQENTFTSIKKEFHGNLSSGKIEENKQIKKNRMSKVMFSNVPDQKNYNQREEIEKVDPKEAGELNTNFSKFEVKNNNPEIKQEINLTHSLMNKQYDNIDNSMGDISNNVKVKHEKSSSNLHINNFLERLKAKSLVERLEKRRDSRKRNSEVNTAAMNSLLKQAEINTVYGKTSQSLKWIDVFISILLSLNIIFTLIDNELYLTYTATYMVQFMNQTNSNSTFNDQEIKPDDLIFMENRKLNPIENLLRSINGILSVSSAVLIVIHYNKKITLQQIDRKLSKYDNFWTSGLFKFMVLDVVIGIIFFPPEVNKVITGRMLGLVYAYSWNSIFSVIVMIKLYLILGVMRHFSRWTTETAIAVCNNYKVKSGAHFAIKAEMRKRPATILSILLLVSLILLGFSMRSFEYGVIDPVHGLEGVKGKDDLRNLANCLWLIIVTMTTVGYGDFYPRSHLGRFVGVIACIIGMLLLSLIVVSLGSISEFSPEEKKAYSKLKKLVADDNLENKAANVIKNIIKLRKLENNLRISQSSHSHSSNQHPLMERFIYLTQLKKEISFLKNDYKIYNSFSLPVDEMLRRLENKLQDDIIKLTTTLNKVNGLDADLDTLAKDQQEVQDSLSDVIRMQDDISKYMVNLNNEAYLQNILKKKKLKEEIKAKKQKQKEIAAGMIEKSPRRSESNMKKLKSSRSVNPSTKDGEIQGISFKKRKSKRESSKNVIEAKEIFPAIKKINARLGADLVQQNVASSKRNSNVSKNINNDKKEKKEQLDKRKLQPINFENKKEIEFPIGILNNPKKKISKVSIVTPEESITENLTNSKYEYNRYNTVEYKKLNDTTLLGFDTNYKIEFVPSAENNDENIEKKIEKENEAVLNSSTKKPDIQYKFNIITPLSNREGENPANSKRN